MVAFVRYRLRASAEFAKVAMSCQDLGGGEILNIRWSYTDPNPVAKEAVQRSDQDAVIAGLQAHQMCMKQTGYNYPIDYKVPDAVPLINGDESTAFPDTSKQYLEAANMGYNVTGDISSLQKQETQNNGEYNEDAYLNATKALELELYQNVQNEISTKHEEYHEKVNELKSLVDYNETNKEDDDNTNEDNNSNNNKDENNS